MCYLAGTPGAIELRTLEARRADTQERGPVRLLPNGDGWSLVGPDGELLFQALGTRARRQCLEFARARGVLALFS
jgi:hypothetical protein